MKVLQGVFVETKTIVCLHICGDKNNCYASIVCVFICVRYCGDTNKFTLLWKQTFVCLFVYATVEIKEQMWRRKQLFCLFVCLRYCGNKNNCFFTLLWRQNNCFFTLLWRQK